MYSEVFKLFFTSVGHAYLIAKRDPMGRQWDSRKWLWDNVFEASEWIHSLWQHASIV
jgi:hypothetical protein